MNIFEYLDLDEEEIDRIIDNIEQYYNSYPIKKSNGKVRWIDAPQGNLKKIQKTLLLKFLYNFRTHECAVGFKRKFSVKDGAKMHFGNKLLLCVDISNFFNTLSLYQAYAAVSYMLSKLTQNTEIISISYSPSDVTKLVKLMTYKGHVPQGAPTSPALANIICRPMDRQLLDLAEKHDLTYTRYADDMTFSHKSKTFAIAKILGDIRRILQFHKFTLNYKKTRILRPHKRMCVTGVVINDKLSIPKYVWRNVRAQLHNLTVNSEELTSKEYQKLRGKIEWIGNFKPELKKTFLAQLGKIKLVS